MSYKNLHSPHLFLAQKYWQDLLNPGDIVIDATCGNGYDTCFLSKLVLKEHKGLVIALDIQTTAIENTTKRLQENLSEDQLAQTKVLKISHDDIDSLNTHPKLIIYNLGYLPGADKNITTTTETTIKSIEKALKITVPEGAISIMCYPRHEEGFKEEKAILNFLSTIAANQYNVCYHQYINRPLSPSLIWIKKLIS